MSAFSEMMSTELIGESPVLLHVEMGFEFLSAMNG